MVRFVFIRLALALALVALFTPSEVFAAQAVHGPPEDRHEGQKVLSIEVVGARRYTPQRLTKAYGISAGDRFSGKKSEQGIIYLWSLFQVRVEVAVMETEDGIHLRLIATEMPADLEPRFIGNDGIELDQILEWAQLEDRRELFLHQVSRVTARVLEGYKREGYFHAEVTPVIREPREGDDPDAPGDVIFEIIEGPQVHVKEILIHGNKSLPDRGFWMWKDGLRAQSSMALSGPSLFDWSGAEFVEETMRADLLAMRTVYRDNGYLNAVVELDRLEFSDDRSGVKIHLIVDEGEPFIVTKVSVQAFTLTPHPSGPRYRPLEEPTELLYPEEDLLNELSLRPGKVYAQVWLRADRGILRDYYGKDGHIEHPSLGDKYSWRWLESELIYDEDKAEVEVIYRIAQGRPVRIREIQVNGATHTKDSVIRRELSISPGELADMKQIRASLRRLTTSGFFSDDRNRLQHRDPTFRFIPTDEEGLVDIDFIVEEGRVVDFQISGGLDSNNGIFGIVGLTMRNFDITDLPDSFLGTLGEIYRKEAFHGAGQTFSIEISPGSQLDRSRIRFVEPDIFRRHHDRIAMDLELAKVDQFFEDYQEKRTTRRAKLGYTIGFNSTLWGGFVNQDINIRNIDTDVDLGDPLMKPLADQEGSSSLVGVTAEFNHRDTDAGFNPRDGRFVSWNNELYSRALGSDWEFWKSSLSWDEYMPIGREEDSDVRSGFRLSGAAAIALPYGDSDLIPYSERFFLGGYNTVRGFRFRGVGPNSGTGTPVGGESMLRASIEYRYPLYSITRPGTFKKAEMLRVHFFVDAGLLGPEYDSFDLGETRASAGFGLGLMYPFPIVFNFGWPLREGEFDRTQVFSFSLATR